MTDTFPYPHRTVAEVWGDELIAKLKQEKPSLHERFKAKRRKHR